MQGMILGFCDVLRKKGLRISTSEAQDAMKAVSLISLGKTREFHDALLITLVKKPEDLPLFEQAYKDFFFGVLKQHVKELQELMSSAADDSSLDDNETSKDEPSTSRQSSLMAPDTVNEMMKEASNNRKSHSLSPHGRGTGVSDHGPNNSRVSLTTSSQETMEEKLKRLDVKQFMHEIEKSVPISPRLQSFMRQGLHGRHQSRQLLQQALKQAMQSRSLHLSDNPPPSPQQLAKELQQFIHVLKKDLAQLMVQLMHARLTQAHPEDTKHLLAKTVKALQDLEALTTDVAIEEYIRTQSYKQLVSHHEDHVGASLPNLEEKAFHVLQNNEQFIIVQEIQRLARHLATKLGQRYRRKGRRMLDFRKTLSRSIATGGVPLSFQFKKRKVSKPEIVLLCDVSGSVKSYVYFFMYFVYNMHQFVKRIRTFIFVDHPVDVSDHFVDHSLDMAVELALNDDRVDYYTYSNFGQVFDEFDRFHRDSLTNKTVMFILADGRNNWFEPRVDALARIASFVKSLIWINPEPPSRWNMGDSIIGLYAPHCDVLVQCANLRQVRNLTRQLESILM